MARFLGERAADQRVAPGIGRGAARLRGFDGGAHAVERAGQVHADVVALALRLHGLAEEIRDSDDARVVRDLGEERLHRGEPIGQRLEFRNVEVEQRVAPEERTAARELHALEQIGALREPHRQRVGRLARFEGAVGLDQHQQVVGRRAERLLELALAGAERQVRRDHRVGVGVDAEVHRGVDSRVRRSQRA